MQITRIIQKSGYNLFNPLENQGPTIQKIKYVAYALLGLGLAVAATFVAQPLPLIFAAIGAAGSIRNTYIYYRDNPVEFQEDIRFVKQIAYRVLGIFSHKFTEKADALKMTAAPRKVMSLNQKVFMVFSNAAALGLMVASFATPFPISAIISSANAGLSVFRWINLAYFTPKTPPLEAAV